MRERGKTQKAIGAVLLLSVILSTISICYLNSFEQSPTLLRINPASLDVAVGSDFEIDVVIETSSDVSSWGMILLYNSSLMESLNISVFAPFLLTNRIVDQQNGFLLVEGSGGPSAGLIPLISFKFYPSKPGASSLEIGDYYVDDYDHNPIKVDQVSAGFVVQWLSGAGFSDYAVNGVPDFCQEQLDWRNPLTYAWSWSGPSAAADALWWMDSAHNSGSSSPPTVSNGSALIHSYDSWDEHDPRNVAPLIQDLAWYMDTDGNRTSQEVNGTNIDGMVGGLEAYISSVSMDDKFSVREMKAPNFDDIRKQFERGDVTIILLGFWQKRPDDEGLWTRVGGHYVAVAGLDPGNNRIAFSDPYGDNAENTGLGFVAPLGSHGHLPETPDTIHNDASYVSHDFYNLTRGLDELNQSQLEVVYDPSYLSEVVNDSSGHNTPTEFASLQGGFDPSLNVTTEIEHAVVLASKTGLVAVGSASGSVNVWDFYGSHQWSWDSDYPVVSVAMTNDGRYVVVGSRSSSLPTVGYLSLFDNSRDSPSSEMLWSILLPVSTSVISNLSGTESKSVDVKNNRFNGGPVVVAATDTGLSLRDSNGSLIFSYSDGSGESIARFSDDGNCLVCSGLNSGVVHYFSDLRDGTAGWGPGDGAPMWSYGGGELGLYAYWIGIDALGGYVVASVYPAPVSGSQSSSRVVLFDRAGAPVWTRGLSKGGFVKVDISCDGKRVVAVNSDPSDSVGSDLTYWSELTDGLAGWNAGDAVPSFVFWPGKELGQPHNVTDDFYALGISEEGGLLVAGGTSADAYMVSSSGETVRNVSDSGGVVESIGLTFDAKYAAFGYDCGIVRVVDSTLGLKWTAQTNGTVSSIAISKEYPNPDISSLIDVTVLNVSSGKDGCVPLSTVTQNNTCNLSVEVYNRGNIPVSTTVSVRANASLIGVETGNVSAGEHFVLSFLWNTTGLGRGNYTLTAFVEIVPGEREFSYNSISDVYVVKVCGPGDVNGDDRCNLRDLNLICSSFLATPVATNWSANADLNNDQVVDMRDLGVACNNFGNVYV